MINDIVGWLDALEYRMRTLINKLRKLVVGNVDLVTYMADNNICYNSICFTNRDGSVLVVSTDNDEWVSITVKNIVTSTGRYVDVDVDVHGYNTLVYIIDNWDKIMCYVEACRNVEKQLRMAKEVLKRAEYIAFMYNDAGIADKVWDRIKKWLSLPVIV